MKHRVLLNMGLLNLKNNHPQHRLHLQKNSQTTDDRRGVSCREHVLLLKNLNKLHHPIVKNRPTHRKRSFIRWSTIKKPVSSGSSCMTAVLQRRRVKPRTTGGFTNNFWSTIAKRTRLT